MGTYQKATKVEIKTFTVPREVVFSDIGKVVYRYCVEIWHDTNITKNKLCQTREEAEQWAKENETCWIPDYNDITMGGKFGCD